MQYQGMTPSVAALFGAIVDLALRADVTTTCVAFRTTRIALIVESNLKPITVDCALYVLERDGWIKREGKPGKGTWITVLRLPTCTKDEAA